MKRVFAVVLVSTLAAGFLASATAKDAMDSALRAEIARIQAIDNHTHDDPVTRQRGAGWRSD
ncbi:MAG TPA: hypothetical protein VGC34_05050, partial [Steroidobacteraceae bacterium]